MRRRPSLPLRTESRGNLEFPTACTSLNIAFLPGRVDNLYRVLHCKCRQHCRKGRFAENAKKWILFFGISDESRRIFPRFYTDSTRNTRIVPEIQRFCECRFLIFSFIFPTFSSFQTVGKDPAGCCKIQSFWIFLQIISPFFGKSVKISSEMFRNGLQATKTGRSGMQGDFKCRFSPVPGDR